MSVLTIILAIAAIAQIQRQLGAQRYNMLAVLGLLGGAFLAFHVILLLVLGGFL